MAIDYAALNVEITTDPTGRGYAAPLAEGAYNTVADLLNERQSSIQIDNFITAFDLEEAVDPAEFPSAGNQQNLRDMWRDILVSVGGGTINANATNLKAKVLAIFLAGNTRTNLAALQTRDGSRAEQLFGINVVVSPPDIARALGT